MANLNKENIITVDVKNATVSAQGSMTFYVTDIKTCNIFCQLVTNISTNSLIKNYNAIDNAEDFTVTLRLIKPNNEPKEIKFHLIGENNDVENESSEKALFVVELTDEYTDRIGTYKCELFVDCIANGSLERITTSSFSYRVVASIMNDLDKVIEDDPDFPLVDTLASKEYVSTEIAKAQLGGEGGSIDLAGYATKQYVDDAINSIDIGDIDLSDYATNESVDEKIAAIELTPGPEGPKGDKGDTGEAGYTPIKGVDYFTESEIASIREGLATTDYVDEAVANIEVSGGEVDLTDYATKEYVDNIIHVIDKEEIGFDDFATGHSNYMLTGKLVIADEDGNILTNDTPLYVYDKEIVCVRKVNTGFAKSLYIYTMENKLLTFNITTGTTALKDAMADIDLTAYATKEYVDNIVTVIGEDGIVGFDNLPEGKNICRIKGPLLIQDINGKTLIGLGVCTDELIRVSKYNTDTEKTLYIYTMDNKYFECDLINGTSKTSTYDVTKEYVEQQVNSAIDTALGNIETLLGEI